MLSPVYGSPGHYFFNDQCGVRIGPFQQFEEAIEAFKAYNGPRRRPEREQQNILGDPIHERGNRDREI